MIFEIEILNRINEIRSLFNDLEIESTAKNLNFEEIKKIFAKINRKNIILKTYLELNNSEKAFNIHKISIDMKNNTHFSVNKKIYTFQKECSICKNNKLCQKYNNEYGKICIYFNYLEEIMPLFMSNNIIPA